jgi:ligand-binding sensor domain-containing protein
MNRRSRAMMLLMFLLPLLIACQAGQPDAAPEAELATSIPTSTETPSPTPTATPTPTPTPEPVFSYFTNGDEINAMTLDGQGYLWAATNGGVVRWELDTGEPTLFTRADGLPTNIIKTITAAADGSIWAIASQPFVFGGGELAIYTSGTVVQYLNGEWIAHPSAGGSADNRAYSLAATGNGVWVGFSDGVSFYDGQAWTHYTEADGLLGTSFSEIYVEPGGRVWAGSNEGINWYENEVWSSKKIGEDVFGHEGLATDVISITRAPNGAMWFGTWTGGARYANGTWSYFGVNDGLTGALYDIEFDRAGTAWSFNGGLLYYYEYNHWFFLNPDELSLINVLEADPVGGLWFGTRSTGALYMQGQNYTLLDRQSGALASDNVIAIIPLQDGSILFGHGDAGISRVNLEEESLQIYQLNTGVPAKEITTIAPNPDGTMWIKAYTSVYFFDGREWENYSARNVPALGRTLGSVQCILAAPDGTLWIGSYTSSSYQYQENSLIASWDGQQWTGHTPEEGFEGGAVALANGPDGSIWALLKSNKNLIGLASFQNGAWTSISFGDTFPSKQPRSLTVDHASTVWVGTGDAGLLHLDKTEWDILITEKSKESQALSTATEGTEWDFLTTEDGLPSVMIRSLYVDEDGNLWVGTDQGLAMYDHNAWKTYTVEDGLADNVIMAIAQAQDGAIWVGTLAGASRFDGTSWQTLTAADGLGITSIVEIATTADGALWFATDDGGLTRYGPPQQP